jgi:hypothetical protein
VQPALLLAGASLVYAFVAVAVLVLTNDFFEDEPHSDALLLWLLVPLVSSISACLSVLWGEPLLRGWVWLCIVATAFCCWIAAFDYGPWLLPVVPLLLLTAVSPWRSPDQPGPQFGSPAREE